MELLVALLPVLLGVFASFLTGRLNNASLTGAQREQNTYNAFEAQQQREWSTSEREASQEFNAEQAELNRSFQAQQAQNEMDFQREMDSTVYQRRVADMRAAGVNPALAIGGVSVAGGFGASGNGSAATSSPGAGASASGSAPSFAPQSMSELMQGSMFNQLMDQLNADIANKNADSLKKAKEAGLIDEQTQAQRIENTWIDKMRGKEYDLTVQKIRNGEADEALARSGVSRNEAETALTWVHKSLADIDFKYAEQIKNLEMQYQTALTQYYVTQSGVAEASLGRIEAEIVHIYEQAATERVYQSKLGADADLVRQQTATEVNRTAEARYNVDTAEAKASQEKFNDAKKEVRYNFEVAEKVIGAVGETASSGAKVAGTVIAGKKLKKIVQLPFFRRYLGGGR